MYIDKYPEKCEDTIEVHLIGWLEQEYEPEEYTQAQMDELDELVNQWIDAHQGLI